MKKILFATLITTLLYLPNLQAQEIKYGIRAGLNVSDWSGDAAATIENAVSLTVVFETRSNVGFHLGSYFEIPVGDRLIIEPALVYSQKGINLKGRLPENLPGIFDLLNVNATITNKAHYIDLPVIARYNIGHGFNIFGGPQVSYLVSNRLNVEAGALGFNVLNEALDIDEGFRKVDVGLTAGLGYSFPGGVNISAGYDFGLTSLDDRNNFDVYNRVAKISVGYTF